MVNDKMKQGYEKAAKMKICIHEDKPLKEYNSTGENLLDEVVSAKMIETVCVFCSSQNVRFLAKI